MTTRVRFAPSNTGTLHIGGARTALYNWLVARQRKGTFLLRIEDTDLARSKPEFTDNILSSLEWLGIDWDEGPKKGGAHGPYWQTERGAQGLYKPYIDKLVTGGGLYRCFCTKERLDALSAEQKAKKLQPGYDRRCRVLSADESAKRAKSEAFVWRLKLPESGLSWDDGVAGKVVWTPENMSDEVVIRSDGSPMYNLVVACDDIGMKITDIIRGADHMSNTPKQLHVYNSLGVTPPRFSHIPLIFGPNGKKLSKRAPVLMGTTAKNAEVYVTPAEGDDQTWNVLDPKNGKTSTAKKSEITNLRTVMSQVDEYRAAGYLPDAVVNYLVLLGWSYDDKTEVFSREELIEKFDVTKVNSGAAQFDPKKLEHFQGLYMRKMPDADFHARLKGELEGAGVIGKSLSPEDTARLDLLSKAEKERLKFFSEAPDRARVYFAETIEYDAKAAENLTKKPGTDALLAAYRKDLEGASFDDSKALEERARAFATAQGLKFGELVHPIRAALTGTTQGPGLFDVVRLCGKKRSLERLEKAESWIKTRPAKV